MSYALPASAQDALADARAQDGRPLGELAAEGPLLLVFLRHFG